MTFGVNLILNNPRNNEVSILMNYLAHQASVNLDELPLEETVTSSLRVETEVVLEILAFIPNIDDIVAECQLANIDNNSITFFIDNRGESEYKKFVLTNSTLTDISTGSNYEVDLSYIVQEDQDDDSDEEDPIPPSEMEIAESNALEAEMISQFSDNPDGRMSGEMGISGNTPQEVLDLISSDH